MSMKKKGRTAAIPALVLLLCLAAAAVVLRKKSGLVVTAEEVKREDVSDTYTEDGVISLGDDYQVTVRVSGPVGEVAVKENQAVRAGDLLFSIDSADYEYERSLAESALSAYEAQLEESQIGQVMTTSPQEYLEAARQEMTAREAELSAARSVYEADQVLYEAGDVSRVQFERERAVYEAALAAWQQVKSRYEESLSALQGLKNQGIDEQTVNSRFFESQEKALKASVEAQKTKLSQLSETIGRCEVRAERDGIVKELPVSGLSYIQAGQTGAVLRCEDRVRVESHVLTSAVPYLKPGTPVTVRLTLRGQELSYEGAVSEIYGYAEKGTSALGLSEYRVTVYADVNDGEAFSDKDGYGVTVRFLLYQEPDVLTVPAGAVFTEDGNRFVFLIRDGTAVKTPVLVSYETSLRTVIEDGLSQGDLVVSQADTEGLFDGAGVRVKAGP